MYVVIAIKESCELYIRGLGNCINTESYDKIFFVLLIYTSNKK